MARRRRSNGSDIHRARKEKFLPSDYKAPDRVFCALQLLGLAVEDVVGEVHEVNHCLAMTFSSVSCRRPCEVVTPM